MKSKSIQEQRNLVHSDHRTDKYQKGLIDKDKIKKLYKAIGDL